MSDQQNWPRPQEGGCYERMPDGSLRRLPPVPTPPEEGEAPPADAAAPPPPAEGTPQPEEN